MFLIAFQLITERTNRFLFDDQFIKCMFTASQTRLALDGFLKMMLALNERSSEAILFCQQWSVVAEHGCLRFQPMTANDVAGGAPALVQPRTSLASAGIQQSTIQAVRAHRILRHQSKVWAIRVQAIWVSKPFGSSLLVWGIGWQSDLTHVMFEGPLCHT